ncbi:LysR substrate-binding domain-containing protein [Muricoccus pecuniae]|uniref:DNA-binding transcriptional LysR family regulator n=1 Tax=Muricoccus pecuniae TaxID=693023 RepID=A0A840Y6M7_9PROT|nr:LysR substrate-binding domain-containing protein [Roseomonas pecuniae]MBB5692017.1 DNA-binding transcriptional LysR family regulator [Roseomonas pecuniae]
MFELGQLRCFVAVAEDLHFRRAAARLNMTQPPLSRQIQLLEHELGFLLLLRSSRAVRLTPAGRVFLEQARRILRMAEDAAGEALRVARGEIGSLTLGFTAASGYAVLPRLVALLRKGAPGIELNLREMVTGDQLAALRAGTLDAGLLRPPATGPGLRAARLEREPLLVALPSDHPLASGGPVDPAVLDGQPLITYPPVEGRYLHDLVLAVLRLSGAAPGRVQHVSQTHSILALVGAGIGLALVPRAAERLLPLGVVLRPLLGPPPVAELLLAWTEAENPARDAVLSLLRREWPGLAPETAGAAAR